MKTMDFIESQRDMRTAYASGATGVLASGIIWLAAGAVGLAISAYAAMATLFIGGMFIFPLSILLSKLLSASGRHSKQNVLGKLAVETLPTLFGGLLVAFYISQFELDMFFPIVLLAIGARYFVFQTLYGIKEYWVLGGLLMQAGMLCAALSAPFIAGAFAGGIIELVFAALLLCKSQSRVN